MGRECIESMNLGSKQLVTSYNGDGNSNRLRTKGTELFKSDITVGSGIRGELIGGGGAKGLLSGAFDPCGTRQ